MMRHHGGGIGHLQDFHSVDHEQNDMAEEDTWDVDLEDGTRPRGESSVTVDSDSDPESETDYDASSGSDRGDNDSSGDDELNGYATP
jgi:hypothetical protein